MEAEICKYIYIYIQRERERERERPLSRNREREVRGILLFTTQLRENFTPQFGFGEGKAKTVTKHAHALLEVWRV